MVHVVIYTTLTCPYCQNAKELLHAKNVEYVEIDVTTDQEKMLEMLNKSNGRRTVPQIFIDDYHVGGFDDLKEFNNAGELDKLLNK
jgi:glutaredoxin 3